MGREGATLEARKGFSLLSLSSLFSLFFLSLVSTHFCSFSTALVNRKCKEKSGQKVILRGRESLSRAVSR